LQWFLIDVRDYRGGCLAAFESRIEWKISVLAETEVSRDVYRDTLPGLALVKSSDRDPSSHPRNDADQRRSPACR
jgi:hypothetical protein